VPISSSEIGNLMALLERVPAQDMIMCAWKPLVILILAIWLVIVGSHHEPWFDEAQAWLLARDNTLLQLLVERLRYEGTPPLWHMLLWLFIRAGFSYSALWIIPALCALAGSAIILWRAPFPPLLRVLLVASYFPAYQYAVIARSYSLDLVLAPLAAALFRSRIQKPLPYSITLGLMANLNAHSFVFAAVLGCELLVSLWRSQRLYDVDGMCGISFIILCGIFGAAVAFPPPDGVYLGTFGGIERAGQLFSAAFVDRSLFWSSDPPPESGSTAGFVSLILFLPSYFLFTRSRYLNLAAASILSIALFSAVVYSSIWHSGIFLLVWIFCLWICWADLTTPPRLRTLVTASVVLLAAVQTTQAVQTGLWDIANVYCPASIAAQTVRTIKEEHPDWSIAGFGFKTLALQPFFPRNLYANYFGGSPDNAAAIWKAAGYGFLMWPASGIDPFAGNYDILVVSGDVLGKTGRAELAGRASRAGYSVYSVLPGALRWRGYTYEDDTIFLLTRRPN
jgi:hypothetical protein